MDGGRRGGVKSSRRLEGVGQKHTDSCLRCSYCEVVLPVFSTRLVAMPGVVTCAVWLLLSWRHHKNKPQQQRSMFVAAMSKDGSQCLSWLRCIHPARAMFVASGVWSRMTRGTIVMIIFFFGAPTSVTWTGRREDETEGIQQEEGLLARGQLFGGEDDACTFSSKSSRTEKNMARVACRSCTVASDYTTLLLYSGDVFHVCSALSALSG